MTRVPPLPLHYILCIPIMLDPPTGGTSSAKKGTAGTGEAYRPHGSRTCGLASGLVPVHQNLFPALSTSVIQKWLNQTDVLIV